MHARELVEVAGLVALNGPLLIAGSHAPSNVYLEQYWATSKGRYDNWCRTLKSYALAVHDESHEHFDEWVRFRAALDEIFLSEMLTRVWTAVLVAGDRAAKINTAEPIARNVLATHLEARRRALTLLVHARGINTHQAVAVNRLRRRAERWADVLIGGLLHLADVREFAVDADRAADFAEDLGRARHEPGGRHAWRLTLVSLRTAFQGGLAPMAANADANARVAASILGCFPPDLFDTTGVFQSLWMMRLSANATDAQGMIADLLRSESGRAIGKPQPHRRRI